MTNLSPVVKWVPYHGILLRELRKTGKDMNLETQLSASHDSNIHTHNAGTFGVSYFLPKNLENKFEIKLFQLASSRLAVLTSFIFYFVVL